MLLDLPILSVSVHNKKKHQRDRLRQVISKRAEKRVLSPQELRNIKLRNGTHLNSRLSPDSHVKKKKKSITNGLAQKTRLLAIKKVINL